MDGSRFLVRISASGVLSRTDAGFGAVTEEALAALLDTDVTERLRLPALPPEWDSACPLCYFIDARGGDRGLPANFAGTCFYHTGCPIFGDLLLAACSPDSAETAVRGLTAPEADCLMQWLAEQFPAYLQR